MFHGSLLFGEVGAAIFLTPSFWTELHHLGFLRRAFGGSDGGLWVGIVVVYGGGHENEKSRCLGIGLQVYIGTYYCS